MNDQRIYDVNDVHLRISQCLALHIFKFIQNADQMGREIPDISSQICYKYTFCQKPDCRNHHVTPTPTILYQRLMFVRLQYTVMIKFDVDLLKYHRLLKNEQIKKTHNSQKWWAEKLVKIHIRYQSPHISCPEITYVVLAGQAQNKFIDFVREKWLADSKYVNNFEVITKYMFVFQRLQDRRSINKLNWKVSKTKVLSRPYNLSNLPISFEYYKGSNSSWTSTFIILLLSLF